jgi:hypothetical protein
MAFSPALMGATGRVTMKTLPPASPGEAETVPPWAETMAHTIDSPSPEPPLERERD